MLDGKAVFLARKQEDSVFFMAALILKNLRVASNMERDGANDTVCCHAKRVLKILLGALILVCFVTVLASSNGVITESSVGLKTSVVNRRVHLGHHLIYVSKRRVPNGPDPIHNRRVGESRRPPGRA
ncbi:hypothetical protein V2J09_003424 [Rumex salicifolius]